MDTEGLELGAVVVLVLGRPDIGLARGTVGTVVDAWPMANPEGVKVRWEPLLAGRVSVLRPRDVVRVPLVDVELGTLRR